MAVTIIPDSKRVYRTDAEIQRDFPVYAVVCIDSADDLYSLAHGGIVVATAGEENDVMQMHELSQDCVKGHSYRVWFMHNESAM